MNAYNSWSWKYSRCNQSNKRNKKLIGDLKSVEHKHVSKVHGYETLFKGSYGEILVKGGFSSGYPGEGPRGLATILKELGFNENVIEVNVYGASKSFTI